MFKKSRKIVKSCLTCGKEFRIYPSQSFIKFCGRTCRLKGIKGKPSWNKGLKGFRAGEKRPGIIPKGENNGCWKGENVSYRGLHIWIQIVMGKPEYCVECGKNGTGHNMHWANISGEYKRDITDWIRLCAKCHAEYDKRKGLRGRRTKK